jgi:hypothetical protein
MTQKSSQEVDYPIDSELACAKVNALPYEKIYQN